MELARPADTAHYLKQQDRSGQSRGVRDLTRFTETSGGADRVHTSSRTRSAPCLSQTSLIALKYPGTGGTHPVVAPTTVPERAFHVVRVVEVEKPKSRSSAHRSRRRMLRRSRVQAPGTWPPTRPLNERHTVRPIRPRVCTYTHSRGRRDGMRIG